MLSALYPRRPWGLQLLLCSWLVAAPAWYLLRFSSAINSVWHGVIQHVWH